jgi:hypothetical protein
MSDIIIHRSDEPFDTIIERAEWQGSKRGHAIIPGFYLSPKRGLKLGDVVTVRGLRVLLIDWDITRDQWDVRLPLPYGYLHFLLRRAYWISVKIKIRFILTLYVWGLARYERNADVNWSDIYLIAFIQRKIKTLAG